MSDGDRASARGLRPPGTTVKQEAAETKLMAAIEMPPGMAAIVWHADMGYRIIMPVLKLEEDIPEALGALTELFYRHAMGNADEDMSDLAEAFLERQRKRI